MDNFVTSDIGVVGLGRYGGGLGLTRHLLKQGYSVRLFDKLPQEELQSYLDELEPWQDSLTCIFGEHQLTDFEGLQTCYLNPAVPWHGSLSNQLRERGVALSSDMECFLADWHLPVIGLTGSNGKSTCWEMLSHLLPDWSCGGNRGISVFDMPQENTQGCVLELSSFQLERISYRFPVAIVTTFTPDHLDQHGCMEDYRAAKERISHFQQVSDLCLLGREVDSWVSQGRVLRLGKDFEFEGQQLKYEEGASFTMQRFPLRGPHNRDLLALAIAAAREVLGNDEVLQQRLDQFCDEGMLPLPYRQNIKAEQPYLVVNDSKATTPESTICALKAFSPEGPFLHLICGGKEKDLDISALIEEVKKTACKVYVIGEQSDRWKNQAPNLSIEYCGDLQNAVRQIAEIIQEEEVLLLSPGTSSFDQFRNYKERGECFDKLIDTLVLKK